MITFVLTGHGHFATGLGSSVELIAGQQESFKMVDFDGNTSQEDLTKQYVAAIEECGNKEVIICTDLIGGTPFKTACELKYAHTEYNIEVMSGTNLGLLLEGLMSRSFIEEAETLANNLVNTGKDQVIRFELAQVKEVESEDGI